MATAVRDGVIDAGARPDGAGFRALGATPGLDGLRGVAVVAVVLFHFPTRRVFVGGLFGVDIFFALSGFLVTSLLLAEFQRTGRLHLRRFLARRGWRLLPALAAFLAVYLLADALFGRSGWFASNPFGSVPSDPVPLTQAGRGVLAALTYSFNVLLAHHATFPGIGHLWSLSIEGQYYLLWPAAMALLLRYAPRWVLLPATLTGAALSAALPFLIWHGGAGADAIYYGSLPRMQGLLLGSAAAQLWASEVTLRVPARVRSLAAVAAAAALAILIFRVGDIPFKYQGAITVAGAAATVLVAWVADAPNCRATRLLALPPVTWLGRRSYAIYLWHYLFDCWTNLWPHRIGVPAGIAAALGMAEVSWRLVEAPSQGFARRRRALHGAAPAPVAAGAGAGGG